jgi:lipopolysaccharide export system protein LptA
MPKLRIALAAAVVVIVAVTAFVVFTPGPPPTVSRPMEATGLIMRGYEAGSLTWEAAADRGEIDSPASALSNVALRTFNGVEATASVTARSLTEEAGTLTLDGDVRGEMSDGLKISSDRMTWAESARKLESGPTLLSFGDDELSAEAFTYDTRLQRAALVGVSGTLRRETTYVLSSDRGEISRDLILLGGNVRVASDDQSLRSDELEADVRGENVALRGAVTVAGPGFNLTADSVVVTPEGRTATGNVSADVEFSAREESHGA